MIHVFLVDVHVRHFTLQAIKTLATLAPLHKYPMLVPDLVYVTFVLKMSHFTWRKFKIVHTLELNGIWVRDLPIPMHLELRTGHLRPVFCTKLEEPCSFSKVPDGPYS